MRILLILLSMLLAAVASNGASAATFTVDYTNIDATDLNPGDGQCVWSTVPPPNQRCTLRAAIMEANALAGADTIIVPFGAHIMLTRAGRNEDAGATGDLDITGPLFLSTPAIMGPGWRATIDANGIDRVFDIRQGAGDVTLQGLVITNGSANDATTNWGGGIRALGNGTPSTLSVMYSEIVGNAANAGGGIQVSTDDARALYVYASSLHGNVITDLGYSNVEGTAIKDTDHASATNAMVIIDSSSIYNNLALGGGGYPAAVSLRSPNVIENSTFSGNTPSGLYVYSASSSLIHVTITGSQIGYHFSANSTDSSSALSNTIIAGNTVSDCQFSGSYSYGATYSLDSDGSCSLAWGAGNLSNTDPRLKPLAIRYGLTPVHDLLPGSPAIDHGDPQMASSGGTCLAQDQDGSPRPQDGDGVGGARCDMGAVESVDQIFANGFE